MTRHISLYLLAGNRKGCSVGLCAVVAAGSIFVGCASERVVLEAVGPASVEARWANGPGKLVVFTEREQYSSAEVTYSRHTGYRVLSPDGKLVTYVRNQTGGHDEAPQAVSLPSGSYVVVGLAQGLGMVKAPVLVQALKTTELHLEPGWKPDVNGRERDLVRLPNGQIVGWRAPVKSPIPLDEAKAQRADAIVRVKLLQAPDAVGTLAYSLVETVSVIRNNTSHSIAEKFTVGYRDLQHGVPAGVSIIYLKSTRRDGGGNEWRLLED